MIIHNHFVPKNREVVFKDVIFEVLDEEKSFKENIIVSKKDEVFKIN
jgi:hypothetical protein